MHTGALQYLDKKSIWGGGGSMLQRTIFFHFALQDFQNRCRGLTEEGRGLPCMIFFRTVRKLTRPVTMQLHQNSKASGKVDDQSAFF